MFEVIFVLRYILVRLLTQSFSPSNHFLFGFSPNHAFIDSKSCRNGIKTALTKATTV
jgi:hypothetical protein